MISSARAELARRERIWLWRWTAVVLLLTTMPYVVAALLAPDGHVFTGSLLNSDDTAQFLAAMRQAREGRWLYQNPFTPEDTRPVFMYFLYMLWAKMIGWTGVEAILAYHLLRLLGTIVLLAVVAALVRTFYAGQARAGLWQTAFLIVVFSSGLGWMAALLPREIGTSLMADLSLIEMTTFQSLYVVPHFAWGLSFELLALLCFLRAIELDVRMPQLWLWSLAGGLSCIGLGASYPFALVVVYAVLGSATMLAMLMRQAWAKAAFCCLSVIASCGAPFVAYYAIFFGRDPVWNATHVAGNATGSPSLLATVFGYGLVMILGLAGAVWVIRSRSWQDKRVAILFVWALVQAGLPYLPVAFQGRFAAGWHVALSILAALGLEWLVSRFTPQRAQRMRNVAVILTVPSTMLILLVGPYLALSQGDYPFFVAESELDAVDWLARETKEGDVILASYAMGNTIPIRAPCRVFVGHQFSTFQLDDKLAAVQAFYDLETLDEERMAILREFGISHVYHGGFERRIGAFAPEEAGYLARVYKGQGTSIYRVRLE